MKRARFRLKTGGAAGRGRARDVARRDSDIDAILSVLFGRRSGDVGSGEAEARGVYRDERQRLGGELFDRDFLLFVALGRRLGDRPQSGERAEGQEVLLRLRGAVESLDEPDGRVGAAAALVGAGSGASACLEPGASAGEGRRLWRRGGRGRGRGRRRRRCICDGPRRNCRRLFFMFSFNVLERVSD